LPTKTVYEDETVQVIMNISPFTNGHLLIIPKQHCENILDIREDVLAHCMKVLREDIYPLLKEKLDCKGFTICENNFLGQDIKHFHIHVIPRYKNDNVEFNHNESLLLDIDEVFKKLQNK